MHDELTPLAREFVTRKLQELRRDIPGLVYRGPADFVLQHGKFYDRTPFPLHAVRQGVPRLCFGNALANCIKYGFRYIEGYVLFPDLQIVHHGWNLGRDGKLIDNTLLNFGVEYIGVEFAVERAEECTWDGDATVLDDFKRGWPLLQKPWTGEDNSTPESERLRLLRNGNLIAYFEKIGAEIDNA